MDGMEINFGLYVSIFRGKKEKLDANIRENDIFYHVEIILCPRPFHNPSLSPASTPSVPSIPPPPAPSPSVPLYTPAKTRDSRLLWGKGRLAAGVGTRIKIMWVGGSAGRALLKP